LLEVGFDVNIGMLGFVQTRKLFRPIVDILCGRPLDLSLFELKLGTPVTPDLENIDASFSFCKVFSFSS